MRLATRIARNVKLDRQQARAVTAALVRQRGALFEAIIRALKDACTGRRRRPLGADRAHRGDGSDGAGRRAAAGRRSGARDRAQEPTVRSATPICSRSPGDAKAAARRCAQSAGAAALRRRDRQARPFAEWARAMPFAFYARILGAEEGAGASPGSVTSRMRVDEFPQSGARIRAARDPVAARLRCLAARGAYRGEARHGDHARRGAGDDGARCQGPGGPDRRSRRHDDRAGGAAAAPTAPGRRSADGAPHAPNRLADHGANDRYSAGRRGARAQRRESTGKNTGGCSTSR